MILIFGSVECSSTRQSTVDVVVFDEVSCLFSRHALDVADLRINYADHAICIYYDGHSRVMMSLRAVRSSSDNSIKINVNYKNHDAEHDLVPELHSVELVCVLQQLRPKGCRDELGVRAEDVDHL